MIAQAEIICQESGEGLPEGSKEAEMAARGDEKTAAPGWAGTAAQNQTSVQHNANQFEGKEKASS